MSEKKPQVVRIEQVEEKETARRIRSFTGSRENTQKLVDMLDEALDVVTGQAAAVVEQFDETDRKVAYLVGVMTAYRKLKHAALRALEPDAVQPTDEGNDHWRTLTADEWNYLLHQRSGNRFMLVSVLVPITYNNEPYYTNVQGLLLFPDNFDYSGLGLTQAANANKIGFWPARINKVYGASSSYTPASGNYTVTYDSYLDAYSYNIAAGIYKLIEPANNLEHLYTNPSSNMYKLLEAGCVFLPAVGCREGAVYKKYLYYDNRNNAAQGFYWAADRVISGTSENAKYFWFGYVGGSNVETDPRPTFEANNTQHRSLGCCVRLVWDAN